MLLHSCLITLQIPNETLANESLEGLSDDNMTSVVDTWSRPQTRGERDNLVVEAIPLQFESPFKSIPDELKRTSSPPSPHHNRPTSSKVSPNKPKVSPGQATSSASPPTIPATTNEPPPRSPNKKIPPEKFFDSPKLSKRSLSYEYLQKEKKIQSKLSAIQSNQITSPSNTQKVTSLFLSEKVAVNVPDTRGTSRKGIVYDDELYSNLTNRSQDILNSMME